MDKRRDCSDAVLLQAIESRDGAAFAAFYRRHLPTVLAYLMRETHDPEAAADLAGCAGQQQHGLTLPKPCSAAAAR